MPSYSFVTLDVFTQAPFGGNPLAVFTDARGLSEAQMLCLAREMNLSETTFLLPPETEGADARVRIFDRAGEMPFAGHPLIGSAFVIGASRSRREGKLRLEAPAGLVEVQLHPKGAALWAPRPLSVGSALPVDLVSACASLAAEDILTDTHPPTLAGVGLDFILVQVDAEALKRAAPDAQAFRALASAADLSPERLFLHLYAPGSEAIATRMFAPLAGTPEDPATGSANAALSGFLLHLSGEREGAYAMTQGVEIGRPSRLYGAARRTPAGVVASIAGDCVPMFRGEVDL